MACECPLNFMMIEPFYVFTIFSCNWLLFVVCDAEYKHKSVFSSPLHTVDNSVLYFEITEPASLRYIYSARPARNFGSPFNQTYASVELVVAEPLKGCSRLLNSENVRGNAVLLVRGDCSFLTKTIHAEEAGAMFVMISDDDEESLGNRIDMVGDETGRTAKIPSIFISGKDGAVIRRDLHKTEHYALLNIPVNLTAIPLHKRNHPPWTLCEKTPTEFIQYLKKQFKTPRKDGGAGLQCFQCLDVEGKVLFHVGCTFENLLALADYVDMKKVCIDGSLQVFCQQKIELFENSSEPTKFFTIAEKQRLVHYAIEMVKAPTPDYVLPGFSKLTLHHGCSIVRRCIHDQIITQIFPIHDDSLSGLEENWYKRKVLFAKQPIAAIRNYFGETIGIYFSFLEFYCQALILPAIIGLVYYALELHKDSINSIILLSTFNLLWATAFLESWKRRSSALTYSWGMSDMRIIEEARPGYYGELKNNPVTGKLEPHYSKYKRVLRFYCVSVPVMLVCLSGCLLVMLLYFAADSIVQAWYKSFEVHHFGHVACSFMPTIIYSVAIIVMNKLYKPLAIMLNDWENHRLQSSYDNHLIFKLVMFWFINTFMLMFYVAFYMQDLKLLRRALLTELIVTQTVDQLQETVLPYCMYKWRKASKKKHGDIYDPVSDQGIILSAKARGEIESTKDLYEGTFDDFLELFIQFGYVTLFSSVLPLAGVLAFINNMIEMRTDAVKLCRITQRPFATPASGIGLWQVAFEMMGTLAIITNCALIGMSTWKSGQWPGTLISLVFFIVAIEHGMLALKALLAFVIPNEPRWVQIALARDEYRMKVAVAALREQVEHGGSKKQI